MAEYTGFRNNCLNYPIYGQSYTIAFPLLDETGAPISPSSPDSEVSKNGDTFADCTNEAVEIATSSGVCYLQLTDTEMSAECVVVRVQSTGAKTTIITLYPRHIIVLDSGTAASGGVSTSTIVLAAGASAEDSFYVGMIVAAVIDGAIELRVMSSYVGSTRTATVVPDFNTAPDSDDTYSICILPETQRVHFADVRYIRGGSAAATNLKSAADNYSATRGLAGTALPAAAADAAGGLPISDAGGLDLDAVAGNISNILVDTGTAGVVVNATGLATDAVEEIRNAITGYAGALDTDANGRIRIVDGTGIGELDTTSGTVLLSAATEAQIDAIETDTTTDIPALIAALNDPTAGAIADAVWEEAIADHSGTVGSTAEALGAAGSAGDPWTTALPGAYGAGSAGFIVGTNLNATVSSRSSHSAADVWSAGTRTLTALDEDSTTIDLDAAIRAALGMASANLDTQIAALPTQAEITGGAYPMDTDANGRVRIVDGVGAGELSLTAGLIDGITGTKNTFDDLNDVSTAQVNSEADTALADYDGPTYTETLNLFRLSLRKDSALATDLSALLTTVNANLGSGAGSYGNISDSQEAIRDRGDAAYLTAAGFSTHSAADVWASASRTLTSLAGITDLGWNPDWDAEVESEVADALAVYDPPTRAELTTDINSILSATDALPTQAEITGGAYPLDTDANGRVRLVDGTGVGELNTAGGFIAGIAGTINTLDALDTAQDVKHDATQALIAALNNLSAAQVNAQVVDVIGVDTLTLPGQVTPSQTPTLKEALALIYKVQVNQKDNDQSLGVSRFYAADGTTADMTQTTTKSGDVVTVGALTQGA